MSFIRSNICYNLGSGTSETFQSSNSASYGLCRVSDINNGYAIIAGAAGRQAARLKKSIRFPLGPFSCHLSPGRGRRPLLETLFRRLTSGER